jgi:hypothetical protein
MNKIIIILVLMASTLAFSQVGIGTQTPSSKSILDLTATDKGFLLPRMTTAQRTTLGTALNTTPDVKDKGMQVYDTDSASIWYWNGTIWVESTGKNIYTANGTTGAGRTVGVTDYINFDANTLYLDGTNNRIGIGTDIPTEKLDVTGNIKFSNALMPNNSAGVSGQVLTSAGANAAPTWTTASALPVENTLIGTTSAIKSTVNGVTATLTPSTGEIASVLGFDTSGTLVKEAVIDDTTGVLVKKIQYNGGFNSPITVTNGNFMFRTVASGANMGYEMRAVSGSYTVDISVLQGIGCARAVTKKTVTVSTTWIEIENISIAGCGHMAYISISTGAPVMYILNTQRVGDNSSGMKSLIVSKF